MLKLIGRIIGISKKKGEYILADVPKFLPQIEEGTEIFIGYSEKFSKKYIIGGWRKSNSNVHFKINNKHSETEELSIEMGVFIDEKILSNLLEAKKEEVGYYGFKVIEYSSKKLIGEITDIWHQPANDIYEVKTEDGYLPVPAIKEVIKKIDKKNKIIYINLIDGLLDLISRKKQK